jgi:phosphoribosyl 1,2-cyclic phosphodiesterase
MASFSVKFWGVRGSIACPSPQHMKYGGNTSCIEMNLGGRRILFDAGTGIRNAGQSFIKQDARELFLMLSHTHWDHINGFPFFIPAYSPDFSIHIKAGHLSGRSSVREVLSAQMENPVFPVPLETMRANITYEDFRAGETLNLYEGVTVRTAPLNHPNEATGYRVEFDGRSAVYVTDTEHVPGKADENILGLIEGADLVIYDSTYTEAEFPSHAGWGHSTWNEGMRLCRMANVKRLAIFHHDPDHTDEVMDKIAAEAEGAWAGNFVAREGMVVEI